MLDYGEAYFKQHGTLFCSHVLDLSEETMEFNLNDCARVFKRMAPPDMNPEIDLGFTGGEEEGIGSELEESADNFPIFTFKNKGLPNTRQAFVSWSRSPGGGQLSD